MGVVKLSTAGILDYQKYSSFLAGNTAYSPGSYDLLETEILTGTQASVTFSNLNSTYGSTYQHLQIRATVRGDNSGSQSNFFIRVNGDSTSNYYVHILDTSGATTLRSVAGATSYFYVSEYMPATTATASSYLGAVIDLLDPFETTKNTVMRALSGVPSTKTTIGLTSSLWNSTNALTSIQLFDNTGNNFVSGSRFSLYGLKAA